jgi:cephalosporin hydroxylase
MQSLSEVFAAIPTHWKMEQWPGEITDFAEFVRSEWPKIGARGVVELGVRHGGTSALWHQLLANARVIGVDRIGHDSYQEPEFTQRARQMEWEMKRFTFVEGNTRDIYTRERVLAALNSAPVGLLFIDADHSYLAVKSDFEIYYPLVAPGGLIAFHDIVDSPRTGGGVAKFWSELPGDKREFRCGGDWGGIGVLRK